MTPTLNLILIFVVPIVVIGISKLIEKKSRNTNNDLNELLKEEKAAFEGIVEEKISEVKDNAIDLEIAVKKAGFISKTIEEDLAKLTPRIESYKDYEAAISQYQGQVEALEEAYLEILNRVDTILKERHTIDKTYKRISDVKTKMIELEDNVDSIQNRLVESYKAKFNEFETELYKRFDALTTNLLARDAHYSSMAEQEKEKISALTEEFKKHVAKKEELFTNQLTHLAERTARENIEQLSGLFEKGREELVNRYASFADEVNFKSQDIESRYETLSQSKTYLEEELNSLRNTIHDRLNSITETSTIEFKDEIAKTKETLLASLKEEVEKLGQEREVLLDSIENKAYTLEKSIDDIKEKTENLEKDYYGKTSKLENDFTNLTTDINERLVSEMEGFSNHIKNVLENEDDGIITIYHKKTKELSDLIISIDSMSEETILKAESRFTDIASEINKLREDILSKAQDDMEYSIDNARGSLIAEINELRSDVESESSLLKDKIDETHFQTSEIISILSNKQEEIVDAINLQKEYIYQELEERTQRHVNKLEEEFGSMQKEVYGNIDSYIDKMETELRIIQDKMNEIRSNLDQTIYDIESLEKETENNIKERIEKRIELLESAAKQIEDLVLSTSDSLDNKIRDAEKSIDDTRKDIENYGGQYLEDLKYELSETVDSYEQTQMKSLKDSIDLVIEEVNESEKKHNDIRESLENTFNDFKNKIDLTLEENSKLSENNKRDIVDMLHNELIDATKSFDNLLDEKRYEMNKMRDELDDMVHRVESGKEVFERNMNKVYETVENREHELLSDVEERYKKIEDDIDSMFNDKKENLNSLSVEYHNIIEDSSRNLREELDELKNHSSLINDEYKIRIETLALKIEELSKDTSNAKNRVEKEISNVLNVVDTFKENMASKTTEIDDYMEKQKEIFNKKGDKIFDNIEEDIFHRLNELRSLIDGAIVRYKDEIKDIEHYRSEENSSVFKDIENIGNKIRADYEEYSSMLKSIYEKERLTIDEYSSKAKDEIEKARAESENKHIENEKNYINDYLNEYSSKIDIKIKEKIDILEKSKDTLSDIITNSFDNLNSNIKNVLAKVSKVSKRKTLETIENFKKQADEVLSVHESNFKEKIKDIEDELRESQESSLSGLRNELMALYKSLDNAQSNNSLRDISFRLENLENSLDNINNGVEYKAKEISEKLDLEKDNLISSIEEIRGEFISFKDEMEDRFKDQANNFIADNEHVLSLLDEYEGKVSSIKDIFKEVDDIKDLLINKIDKAKIDFDNKYEVLGEEFDKTIDDIKSAVLDRNEIIELHSSEKELLKEQIDNLKEEFDSFKEEVLKSNDIPTLFQDEREKLEETFDNFSRALIVRLSDAETNIDDLKNTLSEEKLSLLEQIDNFREDIESIKNDNSFEDLAEERLQLEMSFNNLKEDLMRLEDLENELLNMKNGIENTDVNLKDEIKRLGIELSDFKKNFEEKIKSESNDLSNLYEDFERLNLDIESLKENILPSISQFEKLEEKILDEKNILEEKIVNIQNNILSSMVEKGEVEKLFKDEIEKLNSMFNAFKGDLFSKKDELLSKIDLDNKDFKNRIEKRVAYFEDNWADSKKVRNLYASDIRDEVVNLRKEADVKFDNTFIGLQNKMDEIEKELTNWKDNKLNNLIGQLDEAKDNMDSFIKNSDYKKNNILCEMIESLKEEIHQKEKDLQDSFSDKINCVEDKINVIENKIEDKINSIESGQRSIENEILIYKTSLDNLLKDYEHLINDKIENIRKEFEEEEKNKIKNLEENINLLKEDIRDNIYDEDSLIKIKELEESLTKINDEFNKKVFELSSDIVNDKRDMIETLESLRNDVYDRIKLDIDTNDIKISKLFDDLKNDILNTIPNMDDIVSLFSTEKENLDNKFEDFKNSIETSQVETRNFALIFEAEKNKLFEDLDNFKSVIRAESISSEESLNKKIENIKNDYLNNIEKLLEKEKESWNISLGKISSQLEDLKEDFISSEDIKNIIEAQRENVFNQFEMLRKDLSSKSDSIETVNKEYLDNIIENERKRIDDNLESFKKSLANNFSNVDDIAKILSEEHTELENKLNLIKDEIFKDMPKFEDISELFVEERQSLRDEFDSLQGEIRASLPTTEDIMDMTKEHEMLVKKDFKSLENELLENIRKHRDNMSEDLNIFKTDILERISNMQNIADNLENERDRLIKEIDDLKAKYDNNSEYSDDILSNIENDKEKLMNEFLSFRKSILELIREQDETMHLFDKEKMHMLDNVESLKNEIKFDMIKKDEVINMFEDERKNIIGMFESLQKETISPDLSYLTDSFKEDIINIFEESNADFRKRVEDRIAYFEDTYTDSSRIKDFYKDAIDEEVKNIKLEALKSIEDINDKIIAAKEEIEKIENDKVGDMLSKIESAKNNIDALINTVKADLSEQENEIRLLTQSQKGLSQELDGIRKEREALIEMVQNSDININSKLDELTNIIIDATEKASERIVEKENILTKRVQDTEKYISSIESKLTEENQKHLEKSKETMDNLISIFTEEVSKEMSNLKPEMENTVKEFVIKEMGSFENFSDAKKAVEKLESTLSAKINDMFSKMDERVEDNIASFEKRVSDYQNELLSELKTYISYEGEKAKNSVTNEQSEHINNLKEIYINAEKFYTDKQNKNMEKLTVLFEDTEKEYKNRINMLQSELEDTKKIINSSVEDTVTDLKQALTLKDSFLASIEEDKKHLDNIEVKMKNLQNEFAPSMDKLENMLTDKVGVINNRLDECAQKIDIQENMFETRLKELSDDIAKSFNERISKLDDIISVANDKYEESIIDITRRIDSLFEEKNSQFDALKAHYDGMSESLEVLRNTIAGAVNSRIEEANNIIDESMGTLEENVQEQYDKYIARLNSNLEQTLSLLMNDAKDYIQKAREDIINSQNDTLNGFDEKMAGMSKIVDALEKDMDKYSNDCQMRLENIDLNFNEKTNVLLKELDIRTYSISELLNSAIESIDKLSKDKSQYIETEYGNLKTKLDYIADQMEKYLSDIKIFENAEGMANTIKNDVEKLNSLVSETKISVEDMNRTLGEFEELKNMHREIIEYSFAIKSERENLKDTEEKVKMLVDMSEDIQDKFSNIAENHAIIEHAEEGIQTVVDLASQIENKLNLLKGKEEVVEEVFGQVESVGEETDNILEKIKDIKSAMIDAEDTREELMDKLRNLEKDTSKLTKNDKKIQMLISRFDQFDLLIDELGNQRENLLRIKNSYTEQDEKIEKNLERAEYVIRSLETLLQNADRYIFEDGIPIVKPSIKKDKYKGVDTKKEKLVIDLYKSGWKFEQIVAHTNYSREEVESIIRSWKERQSRN